MIFQPGEVVADPMCGKGTILIEAAREVPDATYIGCDIDTSQIGSALENSMYAQCDIQFLLANALSKLN